MNATAPRLPALIGGSGDLDPSTHTALAGLGDFGYPVSPGGDMQGSAGGGWSYAGRNLHFGVREHGMGAILNGLAAHGGTLPFGATFLVFSDYMRPAIRLASLMKARVLFIFTHDSIGLGEDGPTHQPVEHLLSLRAIPGMQLLRPADANETAAAWRVAVTWKEGPVCLVLSRQNLPILDLKVYPQIPQGVERGGYILAREPEGSRPDLLLVATGAEVHLALSAAARLGKQDVTARVVSLPGWSLFERQSVGYRSEVIPPGVPWLAIEAGTPLGWRSYLDPDAPVVGIDHFGASAPADVLLREFGFTVEAVCERVFALLKRKK
jgi:transketolase